MEAMTIQLELNPEFVERLSAEAKARGVGLEEYAEILLREAIGTHSEPQGLLSVREIHAMLDAIAEGSEGLPKVPTSAFTRESFYEERL
jgi:hypothetical protein